MRKPIKVRNLFDACICLLSVLGILLIASLCFAQPSTVPISNSFHLYGQVVDIISSNHLSYVVHEPATGHRLRVECYPSEVIGCEKATLNSWVTLDGYLSAGSDQNDGKAPNESRVTKVSVWDGTRGSWVVVGYGRKSLPD